MAGEESGMGLIHGVAISWHAHFMMGSWLVYISSFYALPVLRSSEALP